MNEFEKLDQLMRKHIPEVEVHRSPLRLPRKNTSWIMGISLAGSFCFLLLMLNTRVENQLSSTLYLEEILTADVTLDEGLEEEIDFDI